MLKEVLDLLVVEKDKWYIDCNLGGGGHTEGILRLGGKVLGIDLDPEAIQEVAQKYSLALQGVPSSSLSDLGVEDLYAYSPNLIIYQANFIRIKEIVEELKIGPIKGILFDLGVSTHQLETPQRGFSFNVEAPLDMRMDPSLQVKAEDLINGLNEGELTQLFQKYGEERFAKSIARKIVSYREGKKIETTNELAQIILSVRHKTKGDRTHPATRVFQALRIAVNDEINSLEKALPLAWDVLHLGGRLVVISFHSLEDRIVKNFFQNQQRRGAGRILTPKPLTPTKEEINLNPRSRSGKLRAIEKV